MARNIYGASGAAQVVSLTGTPTLAAATVKTARTGGTTVTDILNMAGANIAGIVTPDSRGQIIFQGPDNATATYWLDFGDGGPRWAVNPVDYTALMTGAMTAREVAQFTAPGSATPEAGIPYVANTALAKLALALEGMVVPKFASASARDTAYTSPSDGDRCYRTDLHAHQTYRTGIGTANRWVTDPALIKEFVLAVDTASITFDTIPQEWRHLNIRYHARAIGSNALYTNTQPVGLRFNNDSGSNYNTVGFIRNTRVSAGAVTYDSTNAGASGNAATIAANVGGPQVGMNNTVNGGQSVAWCGICTGSSFSSLFGGGEIKIDNYTSANRKSVQGTSGYNDNGGYPTGSSGASTSQLQGGWNNSAAITRIDVIPVAATSFAAGSRFSLYGWS